MIFRQMRATGLEPARGYHQNLNLARLPIPPCPLVVALFASDDFYIISANVHDVKPSAILDFYKYQPEAFNHLYPGKLEAIEFFSLTN